MKVFGLPLWGILAGGFAFWLLGFVFYGVLFQDIWQQSRSLVPADFDGSNQTWMIGGLITSFFTAAGISFALKWQGWPDVSGAVTAAACLALTLGLAGAGYALVYMPAHSLAGFVIDLAYYFIGWPLIAVIVTKLR